MTTTTAIPGLPTQGAEPAPRWASVVLWLIAVFNIPIGLWALLSPQGWFDNFPGYAPRLVAAYPPFNEHLATDAGAGLLTVGVLAAAAAFLGRRDAHLVAGAGLLAFTGPHALFHVLQPSDLLTAAEDASSTIPLVITAAAAASVLGRAAKASS